MEFFIVLLVHSQTNGERYSMPMEILWDLPMPKVHWIDTRNENWDWIRKIIIIIEDGLSTCYCYDYFSFVHPLHGAMNASMVFICLSKNSSWLKNLQKIIWIRVNNVHAFPNRFRNFTFNWIVRMLDPFVHISLWLKTLQIFGRKKMKTWCILHFT